MSEWEIRSQDEKTIVLKRVSTGVGGAGALVFIQLIALFIEWVKENAFYIISIAAIVIVCAIICLIIFFKSKKPHLKIAVTIAIAIGLVFADITFGTEIKYFLFNHEQAYYSNRTEASEKTSYQTLVSMPKDARVSIIDSSGIWYQVQYNEIIGYVNSKYLYVEE